MPLEHATLAQHWANARATASGDVTVEFRPSLPNLRAMEMEITLPDEVPVMTLPNTAFFPQALMPLHIFEPRYRHMLRDVLASNRVFAIAGLDQARIHE